MATLNIGDKVRFLNAVGGGIVRKIDRDMAYVEEPDGFETPVLVRECVVVEPAKPEKKQPEVKTIFTATSFSKEETAKPTPTPAHTEVIEETPEGEQLNIALAFIPHEPKHLNTSAHDICLVNDSNYYLYFTFTSRDDAGWRVRHAGVIEPNMQMELEELQQQDINSLQRIGFQYIAFKQGKHYTTKNPGAIEMRFDTVKLYKLHSFRDNLYYDEPALIIDLVKNDTPIRPLVVNTDDLARAMNEKNQSATANRTHVSKPKQQPTEIIEVDLHINQLLDSTAGMSNGEMLEYQMETFRKVLAEHRHHKGQRIVFIHGKGEGTLRRAILDELRTRYKEYSYQDASFREYGFGATMVTIK
ncbi:MAG: DUF2027 domain-containing protein [Bacteroidaceae bacterium]|nr:DUF2027 domain-containing protein [Bacteroidaceae bacterium]